MFVFFRMIGCTPFLVVSYFYLWFVPPFISGRFLWYLGFYCLYQTLITVSMNSLSGVHLMFETSETAHAHFRQLGRTSRAVQGRRQAGNGR